VKSDKPPQIHNQRLNFLFSLHWYLRQREIGCTSPVDFDLQFRKELLRGLLDATTLRRSTAFLSTFRRQVWLREASREEKPLRPALFPFSLWPRIVPQSRHSAMCSNSCCYLCRSISVAWKKRQTVRAGEKEENSR